MRHSYQQYRDLRNYLNSLTEEELDQTLIVYDFNGDEYMPVTRFAKTEDVSEFDDGQVVLSFNTPDDSDGNLPSKLVGYL